MAHTAASLIVCCGHLCDLLALMDKTTRDHYLNLCELASKEQKPAQADRTYRGDQPTAPRKRRSPERQAAGVSFLKKAISKISEDEEPEVCFDP